jgi:hypothetical protein
VTSHRSIVWVSLSQLLRCKPVDHVCATMLERPVQRHGKSHLSDHTACFARRLESRGHAAKFVLKLQWYGVQWPLRRSSSLVQSGTSLPLDLLHEYLVSAVVLTQPQDFCLDRRNLSYRLSVNDPRPSQLDTRPAARLRPAAVYARSGHTRFVYCVLTGLIALV